MKNIAILIVGQLRLPDLENLYNSIKNFEEVFKVLKGIIKDNYI